MDKLIIKIHLNFKNIGKIVILLFFVYACTGSNSNSNRMTDEKISIIAEKLHSHLFELKGINETTDIERQISQVENVLQKQALDYYLKSIELQKKANMQEAFVHARLSLQSIEEHKYITPLF